MVAFARGGVGAARAVVDACASSSTRSGRDRTGSRLPRVFSARCRGVVGASWASLQDPCESLAAILIGVSGGAVGAVIVFATGITSDAAVTLAAFAGGIGAVFVALAVSRVGGRGARGDMRTLLIAGVIVGAFANAAIMVALASAEPNTVRGALWWMMGSAADATWRRVGWLAVSICSLAAHWSTGSESMCVAGDYTAASLGVDAERSGRRVFCSPLSRVGHRIGRRLDWLHWLVVPHIARRLGLRAPVRHRAAALV